MRVTEVFVMTDVLAGDAADNAAERLARGWEDLVGRVARP